MAKISERLDAFAVQARVANEATLAARVAAGMQARSAVTVEADAVVRDLLIAGARAGIKLEAEVVKPAVGLLDFLAMSMPCPPCTTGKPDFAAELRARYEWARYIVREVR
jgi:hypothetical protein